MKSSNEPASAVVEYAVTGRITWGHLVDDDIPSWRTEFFGDDAEAERWIASNGGSSHWVVLPVISHRGSPTRDSIRNHLDLMGVPEPARSLEREIEHFFKHGAANVDGDFFLDRDWRFDEVKRQRGRRLRMPDIDSQLRNEIVALEDAYRTVHGQLPPAVFWRSRQVCEELLLAAEKHRDEHNRLSPANGRAWAFYEWRVDGVAALSRQAEASVDHTAKGDVLVKPVRTGRRAWAEEDRFVRRAQWLAKILDKHGFSPHYLRENGGPDRKSTKKILGGHGVTDDVLVKLVRVLNELCKFSTRLDLTDVPRD